MHWTRPEDVRAEVQKLWDRGRMLAARLTGDQLFPFTVRSRRPDRRALLDRFDDVRTWVRELEAGSRAAVGHGYDLEWTEVEHRQLGRNRVPERIVVPTEHDALRWIGTVRAAEQFDRLADATLQAVPELRAWITRKPLVVLEHARVWERLLAIVLWLRAHPRPGVWVRMLDLPGVDTKFIEEHRRLLAELLDEVLSPAAIDQAATSFEDRFGFVAKSPSVRFRALDRRLAVGGFMDVSVPVRDLALNPIACGRVFVTENELNGLSFPVVDDAIVIFGLGYGAELLAELAWLRGRELWYWGDVDTHGFVILDRLRAVFPHVQSMLMDRDTLLAHRHSWVREDRKALAAVAHLTEPEAALFDDLVNDRLGSHVRLEQERVGFGALQAALAANLGA